MKNSTFLTVFCAAMLFVPQLRADDPAPLPLATNHPPFGCSADKGGERGTAEHMRDASGNFSRLTMPATTPNGGFAATILFCFPDKKKLEENDYKFISFSYRSNDAGKIDLMIPQRDHKARRIHSFELGDSKGEWITLKLDFAADFKLEGAPFDLRDMRREVIFYNGRNRNAGFPRNKVTFDLRDLRLE